MTFFGRNVTMLSFVLSALSSISLYNELCTTIRLMEMLNLRNAKEYSSERIYYVTFNTVGEKI
jgi:hypothetical protein